ncbi:MAG: imidazolonepropionase, partial [Flavobacteriaceae bacterium]
MNCLFVNIKGLLQTLAPEVKLLKGAEMRQLAQIEDAYLWVEDGRIAAYGPMAQCPDTGSAEVIDARGRYVLPTWCDSHTHLVFAATREKEFEMRIAGMTYEAIAEAGGGILNSARRLQETAYEELYKAAHQRVLDLISLGTGALEIKSGYGLDLPAELKMLRVIAQLKKAMDIPIRATFLAAHAIPEAYKQQPDEYVKQICEVWIPEVAALGLANYIDVFCEKNYFTVAQTQYIVQVAQAHGLPAKLHLNQFNALGGVSMAVENNALTADHLEVLTDEDLKALQKGTTLPVALPNCSFFLGLPYTPARTIMSAGLPLALASDYNPGSAPSGNMNTVLSLACFKMKMTPEEDINAVT